MDSLEKKLCQAECKLIEQSKKLRTNYTLITSLESEVKLCKSSTKLPNESDTCNKKIMPTYSKALKMKNEEFKTNNKIYYSINEDGNDNALVKTNTIAEQHARKELKETEEQQDQMRRRTNAVIFNLAESDDDKAKCKNLLQKYCQSTVDITSSYRMGDIQNGIRPLKISFASSEVRNKVMNEFTISQMNLNHTSNIKKLILMDDLTPKQRHCMRELVKERKKLREVQPEKKWIIRNWKIIAKN